MEELSFRVVREVPGERDELLALAINLIACNRARAAAGESFGQRAVCLALVAARTRVSPGRPSAAMPCLQRKTPRLWRAAGPGSLPPRIRKPHSLGAVQRESEAQHLRCRHLMIGESRPASLAPACSRSASARWPLPGCLHPAPRAALCLQRKTPRLWRAAGPTWFAGSHGERDAQTSYNAAI